MNDLNTVSLPSRVWTGSLDPQGNRVCTGRKEMKEYEALKELLDQWDFRYHV